MCAACSNHVKTALGKIPGVESVKVLHGESEGAPAKLVVVSTSDHLTRDDAVKALGEDAKSYTILSLSRTGTR
jgi:copper chaperone CopZ